MIEASRSTLTETVHHIMPLTFQDKSVDIAVGHTIRTDVAAQRAAFLAAAAEKSAAAAAAAESTAASSADESTEEPSAAQSAAERIADESHGVPIAHEVAATPSAEIPESASQEMAPQEVKPQEVASQETASQDAAPAAILSAAELESENAEANLEAAFSEGVVAANTELKATAVSFALPEASLEDTNASAILETKTETETKTEAEAGTETEAIEVTAAAIAPETSTDTSTVTPSENEAAPEHAAPVANPPLSENPLFQASAPAESESADVAEVVVAADITEAPHSTDVTEDFNMEPLPEAMAEASPVVAQKLGTLTLPAALCDEELLGELAGIPNKMGFKIGEVAEMLGIKQYVLRYWETEFDVLKPKKAANNQRYYTKKDVENVYLIRKLLHRDRFSIEGARSAMKDLKNVVKKEKDWNSVNHKVDSLQERVEHFMVDLRKLHRLFS